MKIIGITGGSGAGKSLLQALWASMGAVILDADSVYHELLVCDTELLRELSEAFPAAFAEGALNRRLLAGLVFNDAQELQRLNSITHPRVVAELNRRLQAERESGTAVAVIEAIYLIESGVHVLCNATVAVTAPMERRIERICRRDGLSETAARERLRNQQSDAFYREHCHYVLVNDGSAGELERRGRELLERLCHP